MQRDLTPMVPGITPLSPFLKNTNVMQTHFCDMVVWRAQVKERLLKVGLRLPMCLPDIYVQGLTSVQKEKLPFATVQKWFTTNKPYEGLPVTAPRELVEMFDIVVTHMVSGAKPIVRPVFEGKSRPVCNIVKPTHVAVNAPKQGSDISLNHVNMRVLGPELAEMFRRVGMDCREPLKHMDKSLRAKVTVRLIQDWLAGNGDAPKRELGAYLQATIRTLELVA